VLKFRDAVAGLDDVLERGPALEAVLASDDDERVSESEWLGEGLLDR
jgi:hypothetical protein